MKKDELITNPPRIQRPAREYIRVQSLQDKIGASAEEIRMAIEIVGFDREKVEQYLSKNSQQ